MPTAGNQGRVGALRKPLPCWSLFTEGHVTHDGRLSACCFDHDGRFEMGDLIAAVVTSNLRLADAPGNVRVPTKGTGLSKPSVVNVSQLVTLDKAFLTERAGRLNPRLLAEVEEGLRLVLGLGQA
jgi:mRNA-degrading endonuclease toxin of MazEF toxin-antitoxin module